MVASKIKDLLQSKIESAEDPLDQSLMVYDLSEVENKISLWKKELPRVKAFYAVKCNPDKKIIERMVDNGMNFDCASLYEIKLALSLGISSDRIIYANPMKQISELKEAYSLGINLTTFDCLNEVEKISKYAPNMGVLLRLATDDSKATCTMSEKYGVEVGEVEFLVRKCKELNLDLKGFAFHIGSDSKDEIGFTKALVLTKKAVEMSKKFGFDVRIIDIGGGFPGKNSNLLRKLFKDLNEALDKYFPEDEDFSIIAEPGRFFVASAGTLCSPVIGKKDKEIFISEGVYGVLSCSIFDHTKLKPSVVSLCDHQQNSFECTLWGPTCDGFDCVLKRVMLPELNLGDLVVFSNMGAYSVCSASQFNGLCNPKNIYIN